MFEDDEEEDVVKAAVEADNVDITGEAGELEYEMSLTRANKELKGTKYADLAMTKVSLEFSIVMYGSPVANLAFACHRF